MPELHVPNIEDNELDLSEEMEDPEGNGFSADAFEDNEEESPTPDLGEEIVSPFHREREEPEHTPRRKRGRPRKTFQDRRDESRAAQIDESFSDLLEGLEFIEGQHKITVYREEPQHDLETGQRIAGLLQTFTHAITLSEIQKRYGGGIYRMIVRGPKTSGRGSAIKANKTVEIAGGPLPLPDPSARKKESDGAVDLMRSYLESKDTEIVEMRKEMKESQNLALQALLQKPDENPALSQFVVQMRDDQRRQEEQRRDEKVERHRSMELQEKRHKEEKEAAERRWKEERTIEERRHEQAREEARMRHERDMMQYKQQQESQSQTQESMFTMMMKLNVDQERKSSDTSATNLNLVQEFQSAQMSQMQANYEMMHQMTQGQLQEARDAKRQNDDFSSTVSKLSQLREAASLFDNSTPDDRPTWERMMDKIGDALPGMMGAAAALKGGEPPQSMVAPRPQITPGSVAVVPPTHLPQKINIAPADPTQPPTQTEALAPVSPTVQAEVADEPPPNTIEGYIPFGDGIAGEEAIQILIRNIDFGISQNHSEELIFEKAVSGLPTEMREGIKELGEQGLLEFMENNVPPTWAIASLQGEEMLKRLYARLIP